jgi:dTDP-4-amino-4,6-dideoxygalactose transaminase
MNIPLLDLRRQNEPIAEELMEAVGRVASSQGFVLGATVAEFEEAVAEYTGATHAIGVASGTDALYLSLRALDLAPGDEVITSPFTFFATAGAVENVGGQLVFADIEPGTFNIDPAAVADAITDRTRAIIPVHLFGQMAEMQPVMDVARERGIAVIEDAAQSIGAKAAFDGGWGSAGAVGTLSCFSFYPTKNLAGWGDGGMITTNDSALADRLRRLRVHGENYASGRYVHEEVGINSRLDAIQAAVLHVKLRHLPGWTEMRRARAAYYDKEFDPGAAAG